MSRRRRWAGQREGQMLLFAPPMASSDSAPDFRRVVCDGGLSSGVHMASASENAISELDPGRDNSLSIGEQLGEASGLSVLGVLRRWVAHEALDLIVALREEPVMTGPEAAEYVDRLDEELAHAIDVLETISGLPAAAYQELPQDLGILASKGALIALPLEDGSCLVPSFQLESDPSRRKAVTALNLSLRAAELPWEAAFWWTIPQVDLAGLSPLAYLELFPVDAATEFQSLKVA